MKFNGTKRPTIVSFRDKNFTNVYDSNFTAVNVISHFRLKPAHAGYKVRNSGNIRETDNGNL